ncbi:MAG TPA: DUF4845 domain-containing protein [Gammaproteobacteria bacterium]|jgi:hypothetical protein|nr:DUF4845 domain-containing protein [Gammaproteobacteria bacterium]
MLNLHRQRGISLVGGLGLVIIVAILGLLTIRLLPVYFDYFTISSVLNEVRKEAHGMSPSAIRDTIERRFEVNQVEVINVHEVQIRPNPSGTAVSVHYEERVPFLANLSLVASFDKAVEVPAH